MIDVIDSPFKRFYESDRSIVRATVLFFLFFQKPFDHEKTVILPSSGISLFPPIGQYTLKSTSNSMNSFHFHHFFASF